MEPRANSICNGKAIASSGSNDFEDYDDHHHDDDHHDDVDDDDGDDDDGDDSCRFHSIREASGKSSQCRSSSLGSQLQVNNELTTIYLGKSNPTLNVFGFPLHLFTKVYMKGRVE